MLHSSIRVAEKLSLIINYKTCLPMLLIRNATLFLAADTLGIKIFHRLEGK
jgi:hypothetical protein